MNIVTNTGVIEYASNDEARTDYIGLLVRGTPCKLFNDDGKQLKVDKVETGDGRVSVTIGHVSVVLSEESESALFNRVGESMKPCYEDSARHAVKRVAELKELRDTETAHRAREETVNRLSRTIQKRVTTELRTEVENLTKELDTVAESVRGLANYLGFDDETFTPNDVVIEALRVIKDLQSNEIWDGVEPLRVGHIVQGGAVAIVKRLSVFIDGPISFNNSGVSEIPKQNVKPLI